MNMREQSEKQQINLIESLLLQKCFGMELDGIRARHLFYSEFGLDEDHHVFTAIMDQMSRDGKAVCTQGWGYTKYRIGVTK